MPGNLRAAYFPPVDARDPRWWLLGLYGVGRVDPAGPLKVEDVVRAGVGRYPSRVFPLGDDLVAIGSGLSTFVVLMSAMTGERVGKLKLPQASSSMTLPDGPVRVFAPAAGQVYDVDVSTPKVVHRHEIPRGMDGRFLEGQLTYLSGQARGIPADPEATQPQASFGEAIDLERFSVEMKLVPIRITEVDPMTLTIHTGGHSELIQAPRGTVEVLGSDTNGNLLVSHKRGFMAIDRPSGRPVAQYGVNAGMAGAGWVPDPGLVVLATERKPLGTLEIIDC